MSEMHTSATGGPYTVRMGVYVAIAWLCIVFFGGCAIEAFRAHQYGPVWVIAGFATLGVFMLLLSGRFTFDQDAVTHQCAIGTFRMRWSDVRKIEQGAGTLVLIGDNSRFVIASPWTWSGPEKPDAVTLLVRKIEASGIVPCPRPSADYKWHKNVRVTEEHAKMGISAYTARSRLILIVSVAVGVASLLALGFIFLGRGPGQNSTAARLTTAINEETAKLDVKPRTIELTSEKAMRVRNAIKHGDFQTARRIIGDVLGNSHLQAWRYYPFADFVTGISDVNDAAFEAQLNEWVAQSKDDLIPVLVRAQYHNDMAWFKRGGNFTKDTPTDRMTAFENYIEKAIIDIDSAINLNDGNPYSFYLKLRILQGFGISEKLQRAFEESIAKYPSYYALYAIVLATLQPKWGGTPAAMYAFVDQYAGHASENSPLKLLYLDLYRDLLSSASVSCTDYRRDGDKMRQCVASFMEKNITPELERQVLAALQLYDHSDRHQFNVAIKELLFSMLTTAGGDAYSGAILQLAAGAMHSDPKLKEDKPGPNNYIIDEAVGHSWYLKGFYDNALTKFQEALKDVDSATFPDEEQRDLAVSAIYDRLAAVHSKLHQFADVIVYEKAAIALGGKTRTEHFICYSYYELKEYDAALRACTEAIDKAGNLEAHYWRGLIYQDSGQMDAALRDFVVIADSDHDFRSSAAIAMSYIYAIRNEIEKSLGVLNKYTYLFDDRTQNRDDLAASYNNRCYAYMQLGDLKRALDDCTASLKYGSLPDAYSKQQELIKRLKAHETGL